MKKYKKPQLYLINPQSVKEAACVSGEMASGNSCAAGPDATGGCAQGAAATASCSSGAAAGVFCKSGAGFD